MAPPNLTVDPPTPARSPTPAPPTWAAIASVLGTLTALTLLAAAVGALPTVIEPRLRLYPHTHPSVGAAIETWLHNLRMAGWPLLFAALGLHRTPWMRHLTDLLLAAFLITNTVLVGAAVAAGGARILPYMPHLPAEWAALSTSAAGWLLASRATLSKTQLATLSSGFALLLALAAGIEHYAVPHR